jgi:glycosyltransferase involved in cell wall biosynthesis
LNILHINTTDTSGSGIAARRLNTALNNCEQFSNLLVLDKTISGDDNVIGYFDDYNSKFKKLKAIFQRHLLPSFYQMKLKKMNFKGEMFTYPHSLIDITKHELYKKADLIHLHLVSDFIDIPSFFKKNIKPIVWTLHDQNPFSGGYHINPETEFEKLKNIAEKNLKIKTNAYKSTKMMAIISPSDWLLKESINSGVFQNFSQFMIPNGIDTKIFRQFNKNFSREVLNIKSDVKPVLLFISDDHNRINKGSDIFREIYKKYQSTCSFLVAGRNTSQFKGMEITNLGFIQSDFLLPLVYSAADLTIVPSKKESFSLVTLESIACGTPVIAFDNSGPSEIIEHKISGYLAELNNLDDFISGVEFILNTINTQNSLNNNCIKRAANYDYSKIIKKILKVYNSLI